MKALKMTLNLLLAVSILFIVDGCAVLEAGMASSGGPVTETEANRGLREALTQGILKGVDKASAKDGYFGNPLLRIPFPDEVKQVEQALRTIGLQSEVDRAILTINRAAEDAAKEAGPIFLGALRQLTIADALAIVRGNQDEATRFLERNTREQLVQSFSPIIKKHMDNTGATRYWNDIFSRYNQIPLVRPVNPDLELYVTDKAIQGLFTLVADEEKAIRTDPVARTTAILRRVFGS
jgi:hypothetical protein